MHMASGRGWTPALLCTGESSRSMAQSLASAEILVLCLLHEHALSPGQVPGRLWKDRESVNGVFPQQWHRQR